MELPLPRRIGISFIACLLAININAGVAKAPDYPQTEVIALYEGTTLVGITPPLLAHFEVLGVAYWISDIDYLIEQYDWNIREAEEMMRCESSGNPSKINWDDKHKRCMGSFGLFQLACFRGTPDELLDPANNIKLAYEIYSQNGWAKDWVKCSKKLNLN